MQKIKLLLLLFSALFILLGCTQKYAGNSHDDTTKDVEGNDAEIPMINYFLPNGSNAHYEGDGNEFAELTIKVTHIGDKFVVIDENNGGTLIRKIYQVENEKIETLSEDAIDNDEPLPSKEVISRLTVKEVYLQKPFEVGATFNDWTIVETDATIETPYQNFEHVLVIEMKDKGFTNRKYFAKNFGEIKRESVMSMEDDEDFVVTSTLESVSK